MNSGMHASNSRAKRPRAKTESKSAMRLAVKASGPPSRRNCSVSSARMRAISAASSSASCTRRLFRSIVSIRLDENGLPSCAGTVNDARNAAALRGANGNDEAIVAEGDVVVASLPATGPQDDFERFLDVVARLCARGANLLECGRSVVTDFAIRKDSFANGGREKAKIGEG